MYHVKVKGNNFLYFWISVIAKKNQSLGIAKQPKQSLMNPV